LLSLPYDSTNIKVDYSLNAANTVENNLSIIYNTFVSGTNPSSSYYFKISSGSTVLVNTGLDILPNSSNLYLMSGSQYDITTYSGNNNYAGIKIYNSSNTLIYEVSQSISSSYNLTTTGSSYFIITGSIVLYEPPL